jgi:hypothetical protein
VKKILLTFLFVKGSKREIIVATGADDFTMPISIVNPAAMAQILKFSPTSPTRTHAHHLLNTRQSRYYQDLKQYVLHEVLLARARKVPIGTHTHMCTNGYAACRRKESIM